MFSDTVLSGQRVYEYNKYCLEDRIKSKRRPNTFENFFQQSNRYVCIFHAKHTQIIQLEFIDAVCLIH